MFAAARLLIGGIVMILIGLACLANSDMGWYPPTVFIGIGILLAVGGGFALIRSEEGWRQSSVSTEAWKSICCGQCGSNYGVCVEVPASPLAMSRITPLDEAVRRDVVQAKAQFEAEVRKRNVAVPCPVCGWYQPKMFPLVRRQHVHWTQIIGCIAMVAASVLLIGDYSSLGPAAATLAAAGAALFGIGIWRKTLLNPNSGDPEPRKQLGQSIAIWGEQFDPGSAIGDD